MKFERPSKIQASTLPMILRRSEAGVYRDLIAQAHNGSGKTTCFVLAMLSRCECSTAVCLCCTHVPGFLADYSCLLA
jgi:ATP-dependent RNA helicase DDX19/DBP5